MSEVPLYDALAVSSHPPSHHPSTLDSDPYRARRVILGAASERIGSSVKDFKDFDPKAKARTWS